MRPWLLFLPSMVFEHLLCRDSPGGLALPTKLRPRLLTEKLPFEWQLLEVKRYRSHGLGQSL